MNLFRMVPWRALLKILPAVVEIVRQTRGLAASPESGELAELKKRVERLEAERERMRRSFRLMVWAGALLFLVAVAALVVAIIALGR